MKMNPKGQQIRLLVVEDDADQRDLLRDTLEEHFGRGTTVGVGSRREALSQSLDAFDLILSDYNLPDGTGMDLLEGIKERCTTPVILVTGENVGQTAVEAIRRGATDYVVKVGDYLFTIPLVVEKNLMVAWIKRENEALQKQLIEKNEQLEQMAATDPLTGLYNRRHFGRVIEQLFAESERHDNDLACIMIDMDGFKQLNDGCGHVAGDQVLQLAGKVIKANLRRMDVAARYGGDEFVVLLPQASGADALHAAGRIAEQFRVATAALLQRETGLSMSIGIASVKSSGAASAEQLTASADEAMYRSKEAGRNRITITPAPAAPTGFAEAGTAARIRLPA